MSLAGAPADLEEVALLDCRGVLVADLAELRAAVGQWPQQVFCVVEGVGLEGFDVGAVWRSVCSHRLLAPSEAACVASASNGSGGGTAPAHAPDVPFSAPVVGSTVGPLRALPSSNGAAPQPAFVVDLGPGPDAKHPNKRKPFGIVCQVRSTSSSVGGYGAE